MLSEATGEFQETSLQVAGDGDGAEHSTHCAFLLLPCKLQVQLEFFMNFI